jgi:hypothetical protein
MWAEDCTGMVFGHFNHDGNDGQSGEHYIPWAKTTDGTHLFNADPSIMKAGNVHQYDKFSEDFCPYPTRNGSSFLYAINDDDGNDWDAGVSVFDVASETHLEPFQGAYDSFMERPIVAIVNDAATGYYFFFNDYERFFIYDDINGEFISKIDWNTEITSDVRAMLKWDDNKLFVITDDSNKYYFIDYTNPIKPQLEEVIFPLSTQEINGKEYNVSVGRLGYKANFTVHPNDKAICFFGNERQEFITWNPETNKIYEHRYSLTGGGYGNSEIYLGGITPDFKKIVLVQTDADPQEVFICSAYNPEGKLAFRVSEVGDMYPLGHRQNHQNLIDSGYTHYYLNSNPEDGLLSPLDVGDFYKGESSVSKEVEFVNHTDYDLENVVVKARLSENTTFELNSEIDVYISKTDDFSEQLSELTYTGPYAKDAFDTFYVQVQSTLNAEEMDGEVSLNIYADVVST